jgi:hypothetical protein
VFFLKFKVIFVIVSFSYHIFKVYYIFKSFIQVLLNVSVIYSYFLYNYIIMIK